jgi:hypothetical protein|tara:strand:+ start:1001 stop:1318 length:318 start_codon:yes stop_codon:yes gene_type:complete
VSDEGINLTSANQYTGKPDGNCSSYYFWDVYLRLYYESIKYICYPITDISFGENEPEKRPNQGLRSLPHLVKKKMHGSTKRKCDEPSFAVSLIQIEPNSRNYDKE